MQVTGFSHYNLRAPKALLDQLCQFYVHVVGLRIGARPPFEVNGYWLYAADRAVLHLTEARASEQTPAHVASTFAHAAFDCRDLAAAEMRLQRLGIVYRKTCVPGTGEPQLFFQDPAGNGVELIFDRG
jgi:catechol-2,3-dioxygenase